jgi:tRNA nucleotidyltransferase (CCA-adding enzyme)
MSLKEVLERAVLLVTPKEEEEKELEKIAKMMLERAKKASAEYPEVKNVLLGGSFAKGTWLPGKADIDIFVLIKKETDEERFERIGLEIGRKAGKGFRTGKRYAQHPYVEVYVGNVRVNIVPCYKVSRGEWKSAADRSVYHLELINRVMDSSKKKEVRLLKKFMQAIDVYGAEIEKEGFSGYASEVLIMNHGSFINVLRYFATNEWEKPFELRDPVDQGRDLARAISREKLATMILASRSFLSNPRLEFFTSMKGRKRTDLITQLYCILFKHGDIVEDILWGELKKTARKVSARLEDMGFRVTRTDQCTDGRNSAILMLMLNDTIPKMEMKVGPPVFMKKNTEKFLEENAGDSRLTFVNREGRIVSLKDNKYSRLFDALSYMIKHESDAIGVSRDLIEGFSKAKVLKGEEISRYALDKQWIMDCMDRVLSDTVGTS